MTDDRAWSEIREEIRELRRELTKIYAQALLKLGERLATVEASANAAHERLDRNDEDHENILRQLRTLSWRVAIMVGSAAGLVQAVVWWLEHHR